MVDALGDQVVAGVCYLFAAGVVDIAGDVEKGDVFLAFGAQNQTFRHGELSLSKYAVWRLTIFDQSDGRAIAIGLNIYAIHQLLH